MINLKYIITGTGRSGTLFFSRFFNSIGIICGHESIFTNDGLLNAFKRLKNNLPIINSEISKIYDNNWTIDIKNIMADSSYMSAPYIDNQLFLKTTIIHIIRNPINVILSFINTFNYFSDISFMTSCPYQKFILKYIPELQNEKLNNSNKMEIENENRN